MKSEKKAKSALVPGVVGGILISSVGDDRMGAKIKTRKNPQGFQQNPKTSLDQKLTPKKIPCRISEP